MIPNEAERLFVSADLSWASVEQAWTDVRNKLDPDFKNNKDLTYELKVNSYHFQDAINLAYIMKLEARIEFTYTQREWSLKGNLYRFDSKLDHNYEIISYEIWSPGA